MSVKIDYLINKQDNFEIVRDKIASILALEVANQVYLAGQEGEESTDWDFDIYLERSNPWELVEDTDGNVLRQTPLVNVYYESSTISPGMSDSVERQTYDVVINIDCLSAKNNKLVDGEIKKGDELASLDVQRVARLVRNIIASAFYRKLEMPTIVHERVVHSITMFQPNINDRPAQACIGARVVVNVSINEYSPQAVPETIDIVGGTITRGDDGLVYCNLRFEESDT